MNELDSLPIPDRSPPPQWIACTGALVDGFAPIQKCPVKAGLALGRGDEADRAVVFVVVPFHQASDPLPSLNFRRWSG